jgi:hypothetical protein
MKRYFTDVTCWQGHPAPPQEQWHHARQTLPGGREIEVYSYRCDCGETISVYYDDTGELVEEVYQ